MSYGGQHKLWKMYIFGQFKDHKEGNMETKQITPFFFIFVFENSQNWFSCVPPFGSFWSVKYLNFGQKLPIQTAYHTFLESRHPEVT